jgi:hypothetical protein
MLIVVCAPAITVAAGVFLATAALRDSSAVVVAAAAAAAPKLPLPLLSCH